MISRHVRLFAVLLAVILTLPACKGAGQPDSAAPGAADGLAGFPALSLSRAPSYTAADLIVAGSAYDDTLPWARVAAAGSALTLDPDGDMLDEIAYATYRFDLEGYDLAQTITLDWGAEGGGDCWLGVSDWADGCWRWHELPAAGWLALDFTPLIHGTTNEMYVVVACTGADPWTLAQVRIGEPLAPVVIGVEPLSGAPGAQVEFSADVSGVPPLSYAWDFGEAGNPSLSNDATPLVTLSSEGIYEATVTVTNAAGEDSYEFNLTVVAPQEGWTHTWGTTNDEICDGPAAVDPEGNLYATSWRNVYDNTINGLFVTKYSVDGDFAWTHGFGAGVDGDAGDLFDGTGVAVDDDYNVYVAGTWQGPSTDPGLDVYLLKLDQDGDEVWSQTWDGGSNEFCGPLVLDDAGNVYVSTHTWSYGPDPDDDYPRNVALLRWDADGDFAWARIWGDYESDAPMGLAVNGSGNIVVLVSTLLSSQALCLLEYQPDGTFLGENAFGCGNEYPADLAIGEDGNIYVTGTHNNESLTLYRYNTALGVWDWYYAWRPGTLAAFGRAVAYDPSGTVLVGGYVGEGIYTRMVVLQFDTSGALIAEREWTGADIDDCSMNSMFLAHHGMVYIAGGSNNAGGAWRDVSGTLTELTPVTVTGAPVTEQQTGIVRSRTPANTWEPTGVEDDGAGGLGTDMLLMKLNFWDIGLE